MEKGGEERRQEKTRQKGDEMIGQQDKIGRNGQDNIRKVNKTKKKIGNYKAREDMAKKV